MLKKKQIKNYNSRIERYNNRTSEKEIETEFYKLISQYYYNKYTINGLGIIDYTAPYNIDGLLEIRTLDHDYRVLVEAKVCKNFAISKTRHEVLAQALQYCRKLLHYGELVPAIIILLEKQSMVIIETQQFTNLFERPYNPIQASNAFILDKEIVEELEKLKYSYEFIPLGEKCKYKKVFNSLDKRCLLSVYKKSKNLTNNTHIFILKDFIEIFDIFKHKNSYFLKEKNQYRTVSFAEIRILFLQYMVRRNHNINSFDLNSLFSLLSLLIKDDPVNNFKIGETIIDLDTFNIVKNSNHYVNSIEDVKFYSTVGGSYFYHELGKILFKNTSQKYIIELDNNNSSFLIKILNFFKINYSLNNITGLEQLIVTNSLESIAVNSSFDYKILIGDELNDLSHLLSKCIISQKTLYSIDKESLARETQWRENNDLLYGFLSENVENEQNSYVLLIDLFDGFNVWLHERGNAQVSLRYFVEALQNHEFFLDNKLVYRKTAYVRKDLFHSEWFDPASTTKMPRVPGSRPSYIIGLKFKQ